MTNLLKTKIFVCIGVLVCAWALSACNTKEAYHRFDDVPDGSWSKSAPLLFQIDTAAVVPGIAYDIQIETVNNSRFGYQNLWLFVQQDFESDGKFRQDTVQMRLADEFGKWTGAGFGSYFQAAVIYKKRMVFPRKRVYKVKVVQGMREEPLIGIEKVGLRISRAE